jgi:hypothetical protein
MIIGGDMAYPTPTPESYDDRLVLPFEYALAPPAWAGHTGTATRKPQLPPGVTLRAYHGPQAFILPGNHDWFDGLDTFMKYFVGRNWFAGWLLPQRRSYFALRLPCKWWIFGVDLALTLDIDAAQFAFFVDTIEREMGPDDRVIVCTHEPTWLLSWYEGAAEPRTLLELIEGRLKGRCIIRLAGDVHHYCRHSASVADIPQSRKEEAAMLFADADADAGFRPRPQQKPQQQRQQQQQQRGQQQEGSDADQDRESRRSRAHARAHAHASPSVPTLVRGWLRRLWCAVTFQSLSETEVLETVGAVPEVDAHADGANSGGGAGAGDGNPDAHAHADGDGGVSSAASGGEEASDSAATVTDATNAEEGHVRAGRTPLARGAQQQHHQKRRLSRDAISTAAAGAGASVRGTRHLLVSGGGGAFLHPTHPFSLPLRTQAGQVYAHARSYPSAKISKKITFGNLIKFRKKNWRFDVLGGVLYFLVIFSVLPLCGLSDYLHAPPLSFIPSFSKSVLTSSTSTQLKETLSAMKSSFADVLAKHGHRSGYYGDGAPATTAATTTAGLAAAVAAAAVPPPPPTYLTMLNASCPHLPEYLFHSSPATATAAAADADPATDVSSNARAGAPPASPISSEGLRVAQPLSLLSPPSPDTPAWVSASPVVGVMYYTALLCTRHVLAVGAILVSSFVNGGVSAVALGVFAVLALGFCPATLALPRRLALASAHVVLHVFAAVTLAMVFEVSVEVIAKAGLVGRSGLHALYNTYAAQEVLHFPDPNDLRGLFSSLTLGLYPAVLKWSMTGFDVLEYSAYFRALVCQACGSYAGFSALATLAYYASFFVFFWVLVTPVFSFVIGCYLYVALNYFNVHWDEGFSSLRISHFKSFIRCRITPAGDLHVFCIGVDRVPKVWKPEPRWRLLPRQIAAVFSRRAAAAADAAAGAAAAAARSRLQRLREVTAKIIDVTSTVTVKAIGAIAGVAVPSSRAAAATAAARVAAVPADYVGTTASAADAAAAASVAHAAATAAAAQHTVPSSSSAAGVRGATPASAADAAAAAAAAADALAISSLFDDAELLAHPAWDPSDAAWMRMSFRESHPSRWRPEDGFSFRPRIVDYFCVKADGSTAGADYMASV